MLWFEVDIGGPGVHLGIHPPAGVMVFHLLLCLLFTGPFHFIFIGAYLLSAVPPQTGHLPGLCLCLQETQVAHAADPQPLSRMNVSNHRSLLGARTTDHEAALPAVVPTLGHAELVRAAHADGRGLVRDPGDGEGGPGSAAAALQQSGPAILYVLYPGSLLFVRGGCYVK